MKNKKILLFIVLAISAAGIIITCIIALSKINYYTVQYILQHQAAGIKLTDSLIKEAVSPFVIASIAILILSISAFAVSIFLVAKEIIKSKSSK